MRFRWKLLILLLAVALSPLAAVSWIQYRSLLRLGDELGSRVRDGLTHRAERQLKRLVEDCGTLVGHGSETIEVLLQAQAREVERCLVAPPPSSPQVYLAEDYDAGIDVPEDLAASKRHFRSTDSGQRQPIAVSYRQQVFKLAPDVERGQVADDIARLSAMASAYGYLHEGHPTLIHWQYTALQSGVHCSYPGHGGYPEMYDPRQRLWYRNALERDAVTWNPPIVDATSRQVMLTISMPVRASDGTPAGVTAIDVDLLDLVKMVSLPTGWSAGSRTMLVISTTEAHAGLVGPYVGGEPKLLVIARQGYVSENRKWDVPVEIDLLESADEPAMTALIGDLTARRSGVRRMPYLGEDCVWAYGLVDAESGGYLLLIVPYDEIIAEARSAESQVLARTQRQLTVTWIAGAVVAVVMLVIALAGSRAVTRPVAQLARTARRIATGDFSARTNIGTRDELGELGRTVNEMIPHLADRLRMRESLALAMEVQQHLLPSGPPQVEGLDIAGKSIYCDETGGDYFDFMDLSTMGPYHLAVTVGDVTGHGIAAALLMATARALLRSRVDQPGTLAEMISDMNRRLTADTGADRFMTLVYLVVDSRQRKLKWVSAGHDSPITYDPRTETFGELRGGGIPLGIEESWEYKEDGCDIPAQGQIIVLGTDGIWEAHNTSGEMFGKDRLRQTIKSAAGRSAEEIASAITDAVAEFRQVHPQEDDVTLVVIKAHPQKNA